MKDYKADEKVNYADLESGDIGSSKGYGPIGEYWTRYIDEQGREVLGCGTYSRPTVPYFCLKVECLNWGGGGGWTKYIGSTSQALEYARELERGKYFNVSHEVELKCAILLRDAIQHYERENGINGYIKVQGKFWGGYEWSYKF